MSAKHALLGLLLDHSAYPYQLGDRLQQRLGPAWNVNSGQLYQTVKSLERDGLIERVQGAGTERDDRHVFDITDAGVLEFERWFHDSPDPVRLCRRPLLAKITFAGPQRLADALVKVDAYERECATRLADTARMREELHPDGPLLRADQLLLRLNLSADIFQLEGELRWARHAREMLSWLANREAVWPSERARADSSPGSEAIRRERAGARRELFERIAGAEDPRERGGAEARGPGGAGARSEASDTEPGSA
jgi:DNA-binding PadR family transcriptional regulator